MLDHYNTTVAAELATKFGVTEQDGDPQAGLRRSSSTWASAWATQDKALIEAAVDSLTKIAGQKPMVTKAKTSVAGFRLREGNEIGCKVTLRGKRMYEFLDRLLSIALPRIRDFRGVNPNSFDGHGNYTLGLAEQVVFPEIDADRLHHTQGMDITIVTSTKSDDQARELLRSFGMPFRAPKAKRRPASTPRPLTTDRSEPPHERTLGELCHDQSPGRFARGDARGVRGPASEPLQALRPTPQPSIENRASAGSASGSWPLAVLIPGVKKASWYGASP